MKSNLRAVWERYVAAWKVVSAAEKRRIFATCLAPACVYSDPLTRAAGWDELEQYMTGFHGQIPGGHFVTEQFWEHHGKSVARWRMVDGVGTPLGEGISYAEYDEEQRLVAMTGFFDVPESAQSA